MLVTLREPVLRGIQAVRDRAAAISAVEAYEEAFHRLDILARQLRADGWECGDVQRAAEVAFIAARAERRAHEAEYIR